VNCHNRTFIYYVVRYLHLIIAFLFDAYSCINIVCLRQLWPAAWPISINEKIKPNSSTKHGSIKYWTLVIGKSSQHKSSNSISLTLPNFQHILDKHPVLNIDSSTFNYDNTLSPHNDLTSNLCLIISIYRGVLLNQPQLKIRTIMIRLSVLTQLI